MKTCKAYLIDPVSESIEEVEYSGLESIHQHTQCACVDVARINDAGDGVFVDDEGLLNGPTAFFYVSGYPTPLAGRGLVLGVDAEGDSVAPTVTKEWLEDNVAFIVRHPMGIVSFSGPGKLAMEAAEFFQAR